MRGIHLVLTGPGPTGNKTSATPPSASQKRPPTIPTPPPTVPALLQLYSPASPAAVNMVTQQLLFPFFASFTHQWNLDEAPLLCRLHINAFQTSGASTNLPFTQSLFLFTH